MKKRFTDGQIIQMLKEQEVGEKTADLCRRYGISQAVRRCSNEHLHPVLYVNSLARSAELTT